MTIKLLALDLDHTLLNDKREIDEVDLMAVRAARATGVVVTIATGRMFSAAQSYAHDLEIDVPIITYQGSLIRTLISEEDLRHLRVDNSVAKTAIEMAEQAQIHINVYDGDKLYVKEDNALVQRYRTVNRIDVVIDADYINKLQIAPTKIVFVENNLDKLNELQREVENAFANNWNVTRSLPHLLELGHFEATKSAALAFIAKHLKIERAQIMAIGDGLNDLDMIGWAGVGVAMGNAPLEVKRSADWVTTDNNSGGVALAINKFILS